MTFAVLPRRIGVKVFKGLGKVALTVEAAGGGNGRNAFRWLLYQLIGALHDPVF